MSKLLRALTCASISQKAICQHLKLRETVEEYWVARRSTLCRADETITHVRLNDSTSFDDRRVATGPDLVSERDTIALKFEIIQYAKGHIIRRRGLYTNFD